jgi:5'-deoxy-5'-methylthioadenosine phosphorylase
LPRIAIIGGSGLENLLSASKIVHIETPYGTPAPTSVGLIGQEEVAFLPRHGSRHELPPHKVNYRANLHSLKQIGVERIIATNAVGAINEVYSPGDLVIPSDILDFTKSRVSTYFDSTPVTHIDVTEPYCPQISGVLLDCCRAIKVPVRESAVLAATEGPRYETPAEIRMLRKLGGDIVGMTGAPEAFLARELEICYSAVCFVSNKAAGMQQRLSAVEVMNVGKRVMPSMLELLRTAIERIPPERTCMCNKAIHQAQV